MHCVICCASRGEVLAHAALGTRRVCGIARLRGNRRKATRLQLGRTGELHIIVIVLFLQGFIDFKPFNLLITYNAYC